VGRDQRSIESGLGGGVVFVKVRTPQVPGRTYHDIRRFSEQTFRGNPGPLKKGKTRQKLTF